MKEKEKEIIDDEETEEFWDKDMEPQEVEQAITEIAKVLFKESR